MLHGGRYEIVNKLGHGTYSTSWVAKDVKTDKYVAVKICTAESSNTSHETEILRQLLDSKDERATLIPKLVDGFDVDGPNGRHACIVTKPTRMSISDAREASNCSGLFRVPTARAIIAQLIHAVAFCHENGIVHGDIHLNNIMFCFPPSTSVDTVPQGTFYQKFGQPAAKSVKNVVGIPPGPGVPKHAIQAAWFGCGSEKVSPVDCGISLADFGEAYKVHPRSERQDLVCHTPLRLRPPEAQFAPSELGPASDVWTLACAIFEIAGAAQLFYGSFFLTADSVTEDWVDMLGKLPDRWWTRWDARVGLFTEDGRRIDYSDDDVRGSLEHRFERRSQKLRRDQGMEEWGAEETASLLDMLKAMLVYEPAGRISVAKILDTDWMVRWGKPALDEMKMVQKAALRSEL
ncbi:Serine/threonine-protein kinase [Diaporthe australafricana]|uniref:Serine/threonine-protein kinase n=1 Tax=Diaporthe australafricana TaxID=127596 RepID=A0ABR3WCP2_9PEZI